MTARRLNGGRGIFRILGDAVGFRGQTNSWQDLLGWFGNYILALVLALFHLPHLAGPLGMNRLDDSWRVDNYVAVAHHLVFGNQYLWTYGPLGFIDSPIEFDRLLLAIADGLQVGFTLLLGILLVYVMKRYVRVQVPAATLVIVGLLMSGVSFGGFLEFVAAICALFSLYMIVFMLNAERADRPRESIGALASAGIAGSAFAISALTKISMLPAVLGIAVLWTIYAVQQRAPWTLTTFYLSGLSVWFGTFATLGGGVTGGFRWPVGVFPLISGYSEAMSLHGSVAYVVIAGVVTLLTICCALIVALRTRCIWWVGSLVLLWVTLYKEGFVRQDAPHVFYFLSGAPWCVFLLWCSVRTPPGALRGMGKSEPDWGAIVATVSTAVAGALCFFVMVGAMGTIVPGPSELRQRLYGVTEAIRFMGSESYARARLIDMRRDALRQRPDLVPLGRLVEGHRGFAWPWDGNAIIAGGGNEVFPPVPQEYSAYTAGLDSLDARFFASRNRPEVGLVSIEAIDGRLPLQTAGYAFVQLLHCYRPIAVSGIFLAVARRDDGAPCGQFPKSAEWQTSQFGEWIKVPSSPKHITIAQIRVRPTLLGTILTSIFRNTRPLYLRLRSLNGSIVLYRIVRQTLPDGIMVSTVPSSVAALADIWLGYARNEVDAISLETGSAMDWRSSFDIRFVKIPVGENQILREPVQIIRTRMDEDKSLLIGAYVRNGRVNSVGTATGDYLNSLIRVEGWYALGRDELRDKAVLAVMLSPHEAVLIDSFSVPGPNKSEGQKTITALDGFVAMVPRELWQRGDHRVAVLLPLRGGYSLLGFITEDGVVPARSLDEGH
jgi:hypothetical protein